MSPSPRGSRMRQRLLVAHRPAGPRAGGSPAPPCAGPDRARDGSVLRRALAAATGLCAGGIGTAGQPAPSSGPLGTGSPRLGRVSGFRTAAFGIPHSAAPRVARHGAGSIGRAALVLAAGLCAGSQCAADPASEPPARVVSINLCTDQLALMLAAPGQLVSVGNLAQDPRSSPMAEAARRLPGNAARAEEIYLMRPDLVLAGRFSSRATVAMLRRLGVKVVEFDPAYSLADIADRIAGIGRALGREDAA